jgi:hypothetical protein
MFESMNFTNPSRVYESASDKSEQQFYNLLLTQHENNVSEVIK